MFFHSFIIIIFYFDAINIVLLQLSLYRYLKELDQRPERATDVKSIGEKRKHTPTKKNRIIGIPNDSMSPASYPKWILNKDWLKGI